MTRHPASHLSQTERQQLPAGLRHSLTKRLQRASGRRASGAEPNVKFGTRPEPSVPHGIPRGIVPQRIYAERAGCAARARPPGEHRSRPGNEADAARVDGCVRGGRCCGCQGGELPSCGTRRPTKRPVDQTTKNTTNLTTNLTTDQPTYPPTNQTTGQLSDQPTNQLTHLPT